MQRRGTVVTTVAVGVLLIAAACGGSSGTKNASSATAPAGSTASTAAAAGQPKRGGILNVGQFSPLATFDPAQQSINNGEFGAIYGDLMHYDLTANHYVGDLALSATPNSDDTVWTVKLRPNVTFTDGTPFNAQAVVMNFTRDMKPTSGSPAQGELNAFVQSMVMPDALTVVFTLKTALADFQFVLADYPTSIAAPSFISQVDSGNKTAIPVGAGPFKLTSFRPNEEITLSANPAYYDGAPYLDGLKFTYVAGGPATYQSFQTGQIQFAVINDLQTEKQVVDNHVAHQGRFSDINNALLINNRPKASAGGSVMSDPRLRQAVAAAFNVGTYNQRVYQGLGEANTDLFPTGSKWNSPSMKGPAYDPNKAKQLVAQVKQETGWDGSVTFVCSNSPDSANIPLAVKAMLDPVGFNVKINNSLNIGEFVTDVIVHPAYDLACWGLSLPDYDPVADLYRTYHSGSQGNFGQFSSPDMNAALDQMAKATSDASLRTALVHFNDVWNATIPWVNIAPGQFMTIWRPNVHGISPVGGLVSFAKVWLS